MKILWFTWKDKKNPAAGGAEIVNEELARRLVGDGHEVLILTAGFSGCATEEVIDGYRVVRVGNRWTVYLFAWLYYRKNLRGWADVVIDEMNTIPFFTKYYVRESQVMLVYQLCREIWFYQMFFPLSLIGYLLEPLYLWLLNDKRVITISESSKRDLVRFGFKTGNIAIMRVGIEIPVADNFDQIEKFPQPTVLSLGVIRSMKRTADIVKAFEIAKQTIPDLELVIAGAADGKYGERVLRMINESPFRESIKYLGRVSLEKKNVLMRQAQVICVTSVKEGWGLIVTEANSQGTPAVVYDVDGLRDSVKHNVTGLVCRENTPASLAEGIVSLLSDEEKYHVLCKNGWEWSKEINFTNSYSDFKKALKI